MGFLLAFRSLQKSQIFNVSKESAPSLRHDRICADLYGVCWESKPKNFASWNRLREGDWTTVRISSFRSSVLS